MLVAAGSCQTIDHSQVVAQDSYLHCRAAISVPEVVGVQRFSRVVEKTVRLRLVQQEHDKLGELREKNDR